MTLSPPLAVVGIDPGGRDTGVVGRVGSGSDRDRLVLDCYAGRAHVGPPGTAALEELIASPCPTLRRDGPAWVPDPAYLAAVVERVDAMLSRLCAVAPVARLVIAIEDLGGPENYRRGPNREPAGLIGLASVWGAVVAHWPHAVQVPQSGNGAGPRQAYPPELWGAREGPAGAGLLRDARSAWDVAGTAAKFVRLGGPF